MKEIKLTQGKIALVDDDDFERLNECKWHYHDLGYARNGSKGYMHRFINNTPDGFETDHINQNKLDNRKFNLRTVTASVNQTNKPIPKNNTSGVQGVTWDRHRSLWKVHFSRNKKRFNIGNYKTKQEAITALGRALQNV